MRGVRYLTGQISKTTEKVKLWSDTLHLLHVYKRYQGPIYKAGYKEYKIQKSIKRDKKDFVSTDIIAWDSSRHLGCGIEITTNIDAKKKKQLENYKQITADEFGDQIGIDVKSPIDVILSTNHDNITEHCHIILSDTIHVTNLNTLSDETLVEELKAVEGSKFRSPQTKFTMDPEPNEYELRNGLVSSIMQMLSKQEPKSAKTLTKESLDFLYDCMDFDSRVILEKRVDKAMNELVKIYLDGVIIHNGDQYIPMNRKRTTKWNRNVGSSISDWVQGAKAPQCRLDQFFDG